MPQPAPAGSNQQSEEETRRRRLLAMGGKRDNEVRQLIAGPSVFICNECVGICVEIVEEELGVDWSS